MSVKNEVTKLRNLFEKYSIDGYIIHSTDEYQNEDPPSYNKRLEYVTGFVGSNGIVVISKTKILFFTDGRYLEYAKELFKDEAEYVISDIRSLPKFDFSQYFNKKSKIAFDPNIFTNNSLQLFANIKSNLLSINNNLIDEIWPQKNNKVKNIQIFDYILKYTGESREVKLQKIREILIQNKAKSLIVTDPNSVCYLLNIRGRDLTYNPILLFRAIVTLDKFYLFIDDVRYKQLISSDVNSKKNDISRSYQLLNNILQDQLILKSDSDFENIIDDVAKKDLKINNLKAKYDFILNENQAPYKISILLKKYKRKNLFDPVLSLRSIKNQTEIDQMKLIHIEDAVAICEFISSFAEYKMAHKQQMSEYDLCVKLSWYRSMSNLYIQDSFHTICGYKENSAIIHYRPEKENAKKISLDGFLLIDSGGHYYGGTTDVTRIFTVSNNHTTLEKEVYTRVLKGHIALATAVFPEDTAACNLDMLARQYLWEIGYDYPHSTSHGVGSCLNVHEYPNISLKSNHILKKNMVLSNEPGYYKEGDFGVRIENMMYVTDYQLENNKIEKSFLIRSHCQSLHKHINLLCFKQLTLLPYCKELINYALLTEKEKIFIKNYYEEIKLLIRPRLSDRAKKWLDSQII